MKGVYPAMPSPYRVRKSLLVFTLLLLLMVLLWQMVIDRHRSEFGPLYTAEMMESPVDDWQTSWEKREAELRRRLHFSQRAAPTGYGLKIGPALLGWSLGNHIYLNNPLPPSEPRWEFALSSQTNLRDLTGADIPKEFYGQNDPRGAVAFGKNWEGHALRVNERQIFFARLVTNRNDIYIVQLGEWRVFTNANGAHNGRITVEYLVATNQPVNGR